MANKDMEDSLIHALLSKQREGKITEASLEIKKKQLDLAVERIKGLSSQLALKTFECCFYKACLRNIVSQEEYERITKYMEEITS